MCFRSPIFSQVKTYNPDADSTIGKSPKKRKHSEMKSEEEEDKEEVADNSESEGTWIFASYSVIGLFLIEQGTGYE